jgi:hypothetical protein
VILNTSVVPSLGGHLLQGMAIEAGALGLGTLSGTGPPW